MALDTWTGSVLGDEHVNEVMAVVANLVSEVVDLQRRVAMLEADAATLDEDRLQTQIDETIARVFSPMQSDLGPNAAAD